MKTTDKSYDSTPAGFEPAPPKGFDFESNAKVTNILEYRSLKMIIYTESAFGWWSVIQLYQQTIKHSMIQIKCLDDTNRYSIVLSHIQVECVDSFKPNKFINFDFTFDSNTKYFRTCALEEIFDVFRKVSLVSHSSSIGLKTVLTMDMIMCNVSGGTLVGSMSRLGSAAKPEKLFISTFGFLAFDFSSLFLTLIPSFQISSLVRGSKKNIRPSLGDLRTGTGLFMDIDCSTPLVYTVISVEHFGSNWLIFVKD
ncbi:hypothetical protein PPL_10087 [Heterostelium album PN500]|uniref:Uncharacterized protein n=1 Tax=Heterostelium pallidum (strain ATCC 26659 / Pp 5 / PN500) TaxID=670386 RepID=D3BQA4_HETP5|nr:hypothetical protein PPL_10087 [Heterostelium album PN500]EFA76324.1 hypothetical protein PPL_10087 [Heterostelium album PN500]|eukprot:XP_020428456.1 hypothetical protein PPL_10087 [Heterostelium album PN500]